MRVFKMLFHYLIDEPVGYGLIDLFNKLPIGLKKQIEFKGVTSEHLKGAKEPMNLIVTVKPQLMNWRDHQSKDEGMKAFNEIAKFTKNNKHLRLFLDHSGEQGRFEIIDQIIFELQLDPSRVFYVCQGKNIIQGQKAKSWKKLLETHIVNFDYWPILAANEFATTIGSDDFERLANPNRFLQCQNSMAILIGNMRPHRALCLHMIFNHKVIGNHSLGTLTWKQTTARSKHEKRLEDYLNCKSISELQNFLSWGEAKIIAEYLQSQSMSVSEFARFIKNLPPNDWWMLPETLPIEIATEHILFLETETDPLEERISEKLMKPILRGNAGIVLGRNNVKQSLGDLGFLTFPIIENQQSKELPYFERVKLDLDSCNLFFNELRESQAFQKECSMISNYNLSYGKSYFLRAYIHKFIDQLDTYFK